MKRALSSRGVDCLLLLYALLASLLSKAAISSSTRNAVARRWAWNATLKSTNVKQNAMFGYSVAICSELAVVGAPFEDNERGMVYLYRRHVEGWHPEARLDLPSTAGRTGFGSAVAVEGDTIIVGAPNERIQNSLNDYGAVYIFRQNKGENGDWLQEDRLVPVNQEYARNRFGCSVDISGDTVIVGEEGKGGTGAYVFERSGHGWRYKTKLVGLDSSPSDNFGYAVAIGPDRAIVGAPRHASGNTSEVVGAAYLFARNNSSGHWDQERKLVATDHASYDNFGSSVAISRRSDAVIIGTIRENFVGSAYIFELTTHGWDKESELKPSDGVTNDAFGTAVDIENQKLAVVGAYQSNGMLGSVYVFQKGSQHTWVETQMLFAGFGASGCFGVSCRLDGETVVVGAMAQGADGVPLSGLAYVFAPESSYRCRSNSEHIATTTK